MLKCFTTSIALKENKIFNILYKGKNYLVASLGYIDHWYDYNVCN